eukprot:1720264-Rhodomonas_salina.1
MSGHRDNMEEKSLSVPLAMLRLLTTPLQSAHVSKHRPSTAHAQAAVTHPVVKRGEDGQHTRGVLGNQSARKEQSSDLLL